MDISDVFSKNHPGNCSELYDPSSAGAKLANFYSFVVLSVLGLLGNIIIIAVFGRTIWRGTASSTHVYLVGLACADFLVLITLNMYAHIYAYPYAYDYPQNGFYNAGLLTLAVLPLDFVARVANAWIVVALAVDRYVQAAMPARAETLCQPKRAAFTVMAIYVMSLLYNIPRFFEFYTLLPYADTVIDRCFGYFKFYPEGTPGGSRVYVWLYAFAIHLSVAYLAPLLILAVTNVKLMGIVQHQRGWLLRSSSTGSADEPDTTSVRHKDTQMMTMLVVVTSFFAVCQIPDLILQAIWRQEVAFEHTEKAAIFVYDLIIINSSVNFFIYALLYRQFRQNVLGYFHMADYDNTSVDS